MEAVLLQPGQLVLGQDEPHQPGHVSEGAGLDLPDQIVGQVDAEQLGLAGQDQGAEVLCMSREKKMFKMFCLLFL